MFGVFDSLRCLVWVSVLSKHSGWASFSFLPIQTKTCTWTGSFATNADSRWRNSNAPTEPSWEGIAERHRLLPEVHSRRRRRSVCLGGTHNREPARRWNGNTKPKASGKLCDVRTSKKLRFNVTANGITKTLEKKRMETMQHVLCKAVLWKIFLDHDEHDASLTDTYIEYDIGDPDYLPDVVSLSTKMNETTCTTIKGIPTQGQYPSSPLFWGESGRMKVHKAVDLMKRYPDTHIVHCRWGMTLEDISKPLEEYLEGQYDAGEVEMISELSSRGGSFYFCATPHDVWRFIDDETRVIHVTTSDLQWKELKFPN